jgi:formate hydrogenlyase subunit 3/multisubunit Na+/H+ antiporter MnhD subunit
VWGDFYRSDYLGVYRLDELFGINIGAVVLILTIAAIAGSLLMRLGEFFIWSPPPDQNLTARQALIYEVPLVVLALVIAGGMAFFPTASFLKHEASSWYIIQKQAAPAPAQQGEGAVATPIKEQQQPRKSTLGPVRGEGC